MKRKRSDIYRKGQGRITDGPELKKMKELLPRNRERMIVDRSDEIAFYKSYGWKKARSRKLKDTPLCEICYERGELVPATIVHHLHPLDMQGEQLNQDNLMSIHSEQEHRDIHRIIDNNTEVKEWTREITLKKYGETYEDSKGRTR